MGTLLLALGAILAFITIVIIIPMTIFDGTFTEGGCGWRIIAFAVYTGVTIGVTAISGNILIGGGVGFAALIIGVFVVIAIVNASNAEESEIEIPDLNTQAGLQAFAKQEGFTEREVKSPDKNKFPESTSPGMINLGEAQDKLHNKVARGEMVDTDAILAENAKIMKMGEWFGNILEKQKYEVFGCKEDDETEYESGYLEMVNDSGYNFDKFACITQFRMDDGRTEKLEAVIENWSHGEKGQLIFKPYPKGTIVGAGIDVRDLSYKIKNDERAISKDIQTIQDFQNKNYDEAIDNRERLEEAGVDVDALESLGVDIDSLELHDSEEALDEWKEKAKAHANSWLDGYAIYDTTYARGEVETWIEDLDEPVDESEIESMCMSIADIYDVAENMPGVPSRYTGDDYSSNYSFEGDDYNNSNSNDDLSMWEKEELYEGEGLDEDEYL